GDDQSKILRPAAAFNVTRPAQLMRPEIAKTVIRQRSLDHGIGQPDLISGGGGAGTELVIVAQVVGQGLQTADFAQYGFGGRDGRPQTETNATFHSACDQDASTEVGAESQRFQLRAQRLA